MWHFTSILEVWFKPGVNVQRTAPRPVITPPSKQQQRAAEKQRLAEDREVFDPVFMKKRKGGWEVVFMDGSSKMAYQQLTGGYGVWYGEADAGNRFFLLSGAEDQTNNLGELRDSHVRIQPYANAARQSHADSSCSAHGVDRARADEPRCDCQAPRRAPCLHW